MVKLAVYTNTKFYIVPTICTCPDILLRRLPLYLLCTLLRHLDGTTSPLLPIDISQQDILLLSTL